MNGKELLKNVGYVALGLGILCLLLFIGGLLFWGTAWVSVKIFPWLTVAFWIALLVSLVVLLPLSAFRKTRLMASYGLYFGSYIFGTMAWVWGFLLALMLWGWMAVIIGIILGGIGVVPIALLACLFNGQWTSFWGTPGNLVAYHRIKDIRHRFGREDRQ